MSFRSAASLIRWSRQRTDPDAKNPLGLGNNLHVLELHPLAPEYNPAEHRTYVAALRHAIEKQPSVRNIALSGTYGTGKSSILGEVSRQFRERVLQVSLLTLGAEPDKEIPLSAESNPAAGTTTNRIQKEIVKQLLYQQSPASSPESRFRRITRFRWRKEVILAVVIGLFGLAGLTTIGLDISALPDFGRSVEPLPSWLRTLGLYLAVPLVVAAAVLVIRLFLHGRLGVEKVSAGPATITLPPRSSSYFDEYLDEIIYFFETNAACDILIVEDLDRFNDPKIFEALRALNSLLNSAKQLGDRNIRFIYAVRDSVFENLGRDTDGADDEARAELKRANRTKFFELVIPVVPFITHKNARDLMLELLTMRGHQVSRDLIDLAARHVADMRLIHNIVNEYEVFEDRLLNVANPVPELDPDRLFAMILFKNAHMADFEAIRHGASSLDSLYDAWRALVRHNLEAIRKNTALLRTRIERQQGAKDRALALSNRLRETVKTFAQMTGTIPDGKFYIDGNPAPDAATETPAFWRSLLRAEIQLTVIVQGYYSSNHRALSASTVQTLMGEELDVESFAESSAASDQKTIEQSKPLTSFLNRHTWKELSERPEFRFVLNGNGTARTFFQIAEDILPSRLSLDLVVGGYITTYFSLHVSSFYGQLIRPDAMTYIMRCIDRGVADPDYHLESADVEAIIRDQGSSILNERSMYNVSILDHLLVKRPKGSVKVIRNLAGGGEVENDFIDQYLSVGSAKPDFAAQLSHFMPTIFTLLATHPALDAEERLMVIDAAIGAHQSSVQYEKSDQLRRFLESDGASLPALTAGETKTSPRKAVSFIASTGATLPALASLSDAACAELAKTKCYKVTAENLRRVSAMENIGLDTLRSFGEEIYLHASAQIDDYETAFIESSSTTHTVKNPENFAAILNDAKSWQARNYAFVISNAHPDCRIERLKDVPKGAWASLAADHRIPMTFTNVAEYIEWEGTVDEHLAKSLEVTSEITNVDEADADGRVAVALALVNSSKTLPDLAHRLALVRSLDPGELPAEAIVPQAGHLIGNLIDRGLLADTAEAFSSRLMVDWPTLEYAIQKSEQYHEIVSPDTLAVEYIAPLILSLKTPASLRSKVLSTLQTFTKVPRAAYEAIAQVALEGRINLSSAGIEMVYKGGVAVPVVIRLLAAALERLTLEDVQNILRSLGEPYSRISDKGRYVTKLIDTPEHQAILKTLQLAGIVSKFQVGLDSRIKVTLKQQ